MASRNETQNRKITKAFDQAVLHAETFEQWQKLAEDYDQQSGGDVWRAKDESSLYDAVSISTRLQRLRRLRKAGNNHGLLFALSEGIHGNMAGMGNAKLYQKARGGTKVLIQKYIDEICDALTYFSPRSFKGIPWADRLEFFQDASHCYGRSALMLSGGGTLGYFHFVFLINLRRFITNW